jgi:hypothetical protein
MKDDLHLHFLVVGFDFGEPPRPLVHFLTELVTDIEKLSEDQNHEDID